MRDLTTSEFSLVAGGDDVGCILVLPSTPSPGPSGDPYAWTGGAQTQQWSQANGGG